jgi:CTP synthase
LTQELKDKIALFCDIKPGGVIENNDTDTIYEVPLLLHAEGLDKIVVDLLGLDDVACDLTTWKQLVHRIKHLQKKVTIGLVGKYVSLRDAYLSVAEALAHGGYENNAEVEIRWIQAEDVEEQGAAALLADVDGIIVPGGFGDRGIEGKIAATRYAREHKIPYFGICLGMHCAAIEFARHVCGWEDAHSTEINPETTHPVIDLLPEQREVELLGGTMRLGLYPCRLKPATKAAQAYGEELIYERHRHRYELNNRFREGLADQGLVLSGVSPDDRLVEMIELADHPWFVGTQFHPEFKSRPNRAHPLFRDFITAAVQYRENKQ